MAYHRSRGAFGGHHQSLAEKAREALARLDCCLDRGNASGCRDPKRIPVGVDLRSLQEGQEYSTSQREGEKPLPCGPLNSRVWSASVFNDLPGRRHKPFGPLEIRTFAVPGNHEYFLEADPSKRFMLDNAIVLMKEGTDIEGLRVCGSPVTPSYGGTFRLSSACAQISEDIDALISHGPPFGILNFNPS